MDQQIRASIVGDAARAQIEHRVLVELPDRRAMRALHVVGEDLELRLRVDLRLVGQEQRLVGLLRVGLLRVLPDDDLAVEDGARAAGQDALVELVARAMRLRVVDRRVRVDERIAVGDIQPVQRALGALAVEHGDDVVARDPAAERDRMREEIGGPIQPREHVRDVKGRRELTLHLDVVDDGARRDPEFRHRGDAASAPRPSRRSSR